VLEEAKRSAEPTHNHPEGIKGAQAIALAVFLARNGAGKEQIRERIQKDFGYDLSRTLAEIRPAHEFDVTCQGTVPVALTAFLESKDFVSAIQNAISVDGDSDTLAAIAGSVAEAFYREIPEELKVFVTIGKLPNDIVDALTVTKQSVKTRHDIPNEHHPIPKVWIIVIAVFAVLFFGALLVPHTGKDTTNHLRMITEAWKRIEQLEQRVEILERHFEEPVIK